MIKEIAIDRKKASIQLPKDIQAKRKASEEADLSLDVRKALAEKVMIDKLMLGEKLTLLCGGNGSGKTTVIRSLSGNRDCTDIPKSLCVYEYRNSEDNYLNSTTEHSLRGFDEQSIKMYAEYRNTHDMMHGMSEGEASVCSSEDAVSLIKEVNELRHQEGLVLLDELDSGLSIDKIRDLCSRMKKAMLTGMTCQVIMSFNSYEMYKCFKGFKSKSGEMLAKTISMYDGSEVCFSSYEEYCDWICENQSKYCKGRGKIMKE